MKKASKRSLKELQESIAAKGHPKIDIKKLMKEVREDCKHRSF